MQQCNGMASGRQKKDMYTAHAVELPIGLRQAKSHVTAAMPVLAAPSVDYTGFRGRLRRGATPGRITGCAPRLTSGSDRVSACGQMRPWDTAHHVLCTKTFVARGCWPRTSLIMV
jgi:hypothetical protein